MVILRSEAVDLANLLGGEYWLHVWDDNTKTRPGPPRLPAAATNRPFFQDI